jgi:hypothetical protein
MQRESQGATDPRSAGKFLVESRERRAGFSTSTACQGVGSWLEVRNHMEPAAEAM